MLYYSVAYSISKDSQNLIDIKKSKFLGYTFFCENVDDVNKHLDEIKKEHKKSTHICYAYIVGTSIKANDDGEPQGTAGLPILDCIKKLSLCNVLCVVVRYFGGIKLGAGGLLRAYSDTASQVLKDSGMCELKYVDVFRLNIDYGHENVITNLKNNPNVVDIDVEYNEKINVVVKIDKGYNIGYDACLVSTELIRV